MKYLRIFFLLSLSFIHIGLFAEIKYDLYVASDGSAEYNTIQDAIDATKAFPDKRITIHIKNGIYKEKVRVYSWNPLLTLKGESVKGTIIEYDDYFKKIDKGRNSTFHTYTLKVEANNFIAENITVKNVAGKVGQAVALHVEADKCQFYNCCFEGNQDTYYGAREGARQYFKNCFFSGTTDFLFGEATVVFDQCEIMSLSHSYITAASTPKGYKYGFVFINCKLTAEDDITNVYLGRPWRPYAKVAFIQCKYGKHIRKEGWKEWSNKENLNSVDYVEYNNKGEGADVSNRVKWSRQLTKKEAKEYTIKKVFTYQYCKDIDWLRK